MTCARHNEYSVLVPDGWTDGTSVIMAGPRKALCRSVITISRRTLDKPFTVKQYAAAQRATLEETFSEVGFHFIDDRALRVAGLDAYAITFECMTESEPATMKESQVYVVRRNLLFTITTTYDLENFGALVTELQRVLASFKFISENA